MKNKQAELKFWERELKKPNSSAQVIEYISQQINYLKKTINPLYKNERRRLQDLREAVIKLRTTYYNEYYFVVSDPKQGAKADELYKHMKECDAKKEALDKQIRILELQMEPEESRQRKVEIAEEIKKIETKLQEKGGDIH